MRTEGGLDSVDFKPFFDMIVGILFILIILISAQMFFAQHANEEVDDPRSRIALARDKEIATFLERLTARLTDSKFDARTELSRKTIHVKLDNFTDLGPDKVPEFAKGPTETLGRLLAEELPCALPAPPKPAGCPDLKLTQLGEVQAELRFVPPEQRLLPPERYGQLVAALFSAALLSGNPGLLQLSSTAQTPLLRFVGATATAADRPSPTDSELNLTFVFEDR